MKINGKKIILLLITVLFLYFVFLNLDLAELFRVMQQFNLVYILPLICSIILSLSFRGLVFKQLLYNTVKPPLKELALLCITSAALNIILPARAGDVFRAFYTGNKYKADKVRILGTVFFERILDIVVIFTFLVIGIFIYHRNPIALRLCLFAGISLIIGFIIALYACKFNKTDCICRFILNKTVKFPFSDIIKKIVLFFNYSCNSFLNGFSIIKSPKYILYAVISSFLVWFFECLNFYIVMQGFNCEIHWSVTLFLISFIALASMIPSTSIFIGPYQIAVIAAFNMYGINKETALAISIIEQAVVVISTSIAALIFLFRHNISYEKLKNISTVK